MGTHPRPADICIAIIFAGLVLFVSESSTPTQSAAFTYQGRLNEGANPAAGIYDFRFAIYDSIGSPGNLIAGPLTNSSVGVSDGLFTTTLDFGPGVFTGENRWLEIGVRTNGNGAFFTLSPRQSLTPVPYAITAGSVVSGGLASGLYGSAVTFNNSANSFNGTFRGNGGELTNVTATSIGGLTASNIWTTTGNGGTTPSANFIGTTDSQPLELRVNGRRALRLEPTVNDSSHSNIVNVVSGSAINSVTPGVYGATIAGGGGTYFGLFPNTITANFGTLGGGYNNSVNGVTATLAGGSYNSASGSGATVGGGQFNSASGDSAAVGGGNDNTASGTGSTVPGGHGNTAAGNQSFAAGTFASANHPGCFVWADSQFTGFSSTANNQFLVRAAGGVGIGVNHPTAALHVASASSAPQFQITQNNSSDFSRLRMGVGANQFWEMDVSSGATPALQFWNSTLRMSVDYDGNVTAKTFTPSSDRNLKENFQPVNPCDVLEKVAALPLMEWNFKAETTKHLGPMAQDFYTAFGVGSDDKHIATVDADGVALAAIQGLNQKLQQKETELAELKARLEKLEQIVSRKNGGTQ
ncbi:MAG TPA: tail fiber domain-containing protein [Verrucomicrobiae bacterium]|nr:tail fiber domain-containing protein [Verrucomicrobiae bacterium]